MNPQFQRFIFPWELKTWDVVRGKFLEKMNSIIEMDSRISAHLKTRPRQISDTFNKYYESEIKTKITKEEFVNNLLPMLQKLISDGPKLFKGCSFIMLTPNVSNANIALTRTQVACLIACMWFGILNYTYVSKGPLTIDDFSEPTFIRGFASGNVFPLACLLGYFKRVYLMTHGSENDKTFFERGKIILKRASQRPPDWSKLDIELTEIFIGTNQSDDSPAKLHTVYAHDFIGGNMFSESLTQEEVILLIRPECLTATIFCAKLTEYDSLIVIGAEKISQYTGYGASIRYIDMHDDQALLGYSVDNTEILLQTACVFIDATPKTTSVSQFINEFDRDLNKAFSGFSSLQFSQSVQVASGPWNFSFNGMNMEIKLIQLILAASASNKCLVYYPFGRDFEDKITPFIEWCAIRHITIAQLYFAYKDLIKRSYSGPSSRLSDLDVLGCIMD